MKKYVKRLISVILSLLMILTALPLSALAGQISNELTSTATGIYMFNQDEDRFNSDPTNGYYKVCNDARDGNFTMAYFKYDVSDIAAKGIKVDSAPFSIRLQANPENDCQGLTFYYTNNKMADYLPDGEYRTNETSVFGIDGMHLTNAIGFFNLLPIQTFDYNAVTWKAGYTFTVDIADAINSAVADGRNTCVIMIAQKKAGGANDTGGWTDTKLKYGAVPVTYTATTEYNMESKTLNRTKYGMIAQSTDQRLNTSAKTYNIVNDAQDNNFTIGFWQFDTSSLASQKGALYSAPMTVTMPAQTAPSEGLEWNGLTFYYCDNNAADSLGEGVNGDSALYGTTGQHLTKAISKYNLKQLLVVPASSLSTGGAEFEIDLSPAINASKAAGRTNVTIMVAQSRAGQAGNAGGWTDTLLNYDIASVTCTYDVDEEISGDLESANRIIAAYENKMANLNAKTPYIYNNMKPAYDAYLVACRYRDAAIYGRNEEAKAKLSTALATLSKATKNMVGWTNRVSSKANKVPTFTATPENKMQQFNGKLIDNILYTTNVSGTNGGESNPAGYAASTLYKHTGGENIFFCSVYYPTATVVLYDGFTTPKIPVMMSGKANYSNWESIIYSLYPATSSTGKTDRSDIYMINKFNRMNNKYYCWVGSGADNAITSTCDFDWSQNHPYHWIGVDANNSINGYSCSMNNGWTAGEWKKLMYYSSALIIDDKFDFKDEGYYKWNDLHWSFIAGNRNTSDAAGRVNSGQTNEDNYLYKGQLTNDSTEHAIYAINYKAIVDVLKSSPGKPNLLNVANYKAGGLNALLTAYADAAAYDPTTANFSNTQTAVQQVGNTIKTKVAAVKNAACTQDTDDYEDLRTAITTCEKTFDLGNENNKNYTAESWAPFSEAFNTALSTMSALYTSNYSTAVDANGVPSTKVKADALMNAYDKLVINREVVDTTELEIVLNNAIAIASNSRYFVESTITSSNIVELVRQCKIAVWGDEESYGLPAKKIDKTPENEAIVANYVTQLADAINKVELNKNANVPGTGKSLITAIYEASNYEADKTNYSNYAILETALKNAQTLESEQVKIDPYVKDQAQSIIDRYVDYVVDIDNAIRNLAPAFNRNTLPNGTVASTGNIVETSIKSSDRPNVWNMKWRHSTNVAYFKTVREKSAFQLPISEMELYCGQTGESYFFLLDSMNLNSVTESTGNLTSMEVIKSGNDPDCSLNQAQIDDHVGNLSVLNGAVTLAFDSVKITQKSNTAYGKDLSGQNINDPDYEYKELLESSDGKVVKLNGDGVTNHPVGGILALNGTTSVNLKTSVTAPATTGSPSAVTLPSKRSYTFDAEQAGTKIGYLAYWKYSDNVFAKFCGYNYEHTGYDARIDIIDLCFLFDLIDIVEGMSGEANNYTNQSWNNLMAMLSNAKSDLNYSQMTTAKIIEALDKRYSDLWEAKAALKAPANNLSLKAAIESTKEIYANDQAKCSPETWAVFEAAYREALSAFSGIYSDTGVRNYETTEQTVIDALAQALTDAKDALDYLVDFSVVDNAADALIKGIENNKYTMASVLAVKDALAALTNLNMPDAERNTHFQSETDFVAAVQAEAESIASIADRLVEAATAVEVLDAAKTDAKAKYNDPDAYSISEIQATLDLLTAYKPVEFQSYATTGTYTIQCAQYADQQEADAAVTQALSNVQIQQYTVTRQDPDGTSTEIGTYPYGTEVTVNSADGTNVDWYYEAVSNTATSKRKLFSTGDGVTFIVKGNTILSTEKASDTNMKKVVFINSLNGRPYSIAYVQSGETIDFAQSAPAPTYSYYSFTNFTVKGNVAASATVQSDMVVYANYEYSSTADKFKLAIVNASTYGNTIFGESTVTNGITPFTDAEGNVVGELKYNDRVTFDPAKYACDYDNEIFNFSVDVNGQQVDALDIGRDFDAVAPIYAFAQVKVPEGEFDRYFELLNTPSLENQSGFEQAEIDEILAQIPDLEMEVISYSDTYSFFVHEDAMIVGLTEAEFNLWKDAGVIVNDYTITVTDKVRANNDGSMSIVGTYCLPQGAEVVESGILFAASKKGAPAVNSMTLAEVETNHKLARMKSTLHTTANQYVITININPGTYYTKYCGYLIYKQNGKNYIVYSNTVDPVVTVS